MAQAFRLEIIALFLILLRVLNVLPPDIAPVNFDELKEAAYAVQTASSDLFNQVFWLTMAALVSIAVWRDPAGLAPYLRHLPLLFVFLVFCVLSAAWSDHPDVAIRRSLLLAIGVYSLLGAIAYCPSAGAVLRTLYAALAFALLLNLASIPLPFAFDPRGLLRGVSGEKNFLGVMAPLAVFTGVAVRGTLTGRWAKVLNLLYLGGWAVILPLTGSKTAMALTAAAPALAALLILTAKGMRVSLPAVLTLSAMAALSAYGVFTAWLAMDQAAIIGLLVPDASFTGRDAIWQFVIGEWRARPVLGFGYGSFWNIGLASPNLSSSYTYIRLLSQAHNGYLDLLLAGGIGGLLIFAGFLGEILAVLSKASRLPNSHYVFAITLLIFVLIHNMTESSLARGVAVPWIFLLSVSFLLVKTVDSHAAHERR